MSQLLGDAELAVQDLQMDSRQVKENSLFVALKGQKVDGHNYISNAIQKGAKVIVCEHLPDILKAGVTYLQVENAQKAIGQIAAAFYDHPSTKIKLCGVTGTNGKTTTTTLLYQLFKSLGYKVGLISTIRYIVDELEEDASFTTPYAIQLQALLAKMVESGCTHCFMEVSSHAIDQNRTEGLHFAGGIFTNITHDHLDYHETFAEYIRVKKAFFDGLPKGSFALSNIDDKRGTVMLQNTKAKQYTYSLQTVADFNLRIIESNTSGLLVNIGGKEVHSLLMGHFNAYNLLAVYSVAHLLEVEEEILLTALSQIQPAEGRFDCLLSQQKKLTGVVDYAHTPDALEKILTALQQVQTKQNQIITVVGCGGDRDPLKRPIMAKVATTHSDKVILTSDNPRSEDPESILRDMEKGIVEEQAYKVVTITNRKEAIRTACLLAQAGDIILVAGKGHEKYQEINGVKHPFDDKKILQELFDKL